MIYKLKNKIKIFFWSNFPKLNKIYGIIFNKKGFYTFQGWGLTTISTLPPWNNVLKTRSDINNNFLKINEELKKNIFDKKFVFSKGQFIKNIPEYLDELRWRHYIVYWSAINAFTSTKNRKKVFVETGVEDGLTFFLR